MKKSSLFVFASFAFATPQVVAPRLAKACSPPPCSEVVRVPGISASIPANLVRFAVLVPDPGPIELRTSAGVVIPASVKMMGTDLVFSPDQAVPVDADLELHHRQRCFGQQMGETQVYKFRTGEAETLSLRKPQLTIAEIGIRAPGLHNNEAVFTRLRFDSADANGAAYPLLQHAVTIDGKPYQFQSSRAAFGDYVVEVSSRCRPLNNEWQQDSCGRIYDVPAAPHEVRVKTHVLGETATVEDAVFTVDTRCDAVTLRSNPPSPRADAGAGMPDAGVGADADVTGPPTGDGGDSGCSVAGSTGAGAGWMMGLLVALAMRVGRRRRR